MKQQKWKYVLSSMMIALPVLIFWILVNTRTEEMKVTGGLTTGNMMVIVGIQTVLLLAVHLHRLGSQTLFQCRAVVLWLFLYSSSFRLPK